MTPFSPLLIYIIVRIICVIIKVVEEKGRTNISVNDSQTTITQPVKRRYRMKRLLFRRKMRNVNMLFNGHYVDVKALYMLEMNEVPCVSFIGELDVSKAFAYITENFGADIKHTYQHSFYDHDSKKSFFNNTIFVMANERMIELGNNYCHLLHNRYDYNWADKMLNVLADFRMMAAPAQTQVVGFARQPQMN